MARTKEQDSKLADALGITYDELQQTDWKLLEVMNDLNDYDQIPVEIIVKFSETSPKHILAKIKGINEDNEVHLSPSDAGE